MIEPTPIPGFEEYGATRDGRIWSHKSGEWRQRVTMSKSGPGGYLKLNIAGKTERVADLVARTFIGPRPIALHGYRIEINHKDLNKQNNADSNLEYLNQLENIDHALKARGHRGVKPAVEVLASMLASVRHQHHTRRMPPRFRGRLRGSSMSNAKLNWKAVAVIRRDHSGRSLADLARSFGVSKQTVWRVVHGFKWVRG